MGTTSDQVAVTGVVAFTAEDRQRAQRAQAVEQHVEGGITGTAHELEARHPLLFDGDAVELAAFRGAVESGFHGSPV